MVHFTRPYYGLTPSLGGDSFTVRGLLNDPTATIVATLVDTNGVTKKQNGLVERDGKFWVENLPVFSGTNVLTLTATDAAGNSSVTNISLSKSDVSVSFDSFDPQQLHQRTMSMSGKVGDATYSVWVNGVKATVRGDGTWTATNVPVNAGNTASFDATAYAPGQEPPAKPGN